MGTPRSPQKVKLIIGLLYAKPELFIKVKKKLERLFGRIDFESGAIDFTHTDYYKKEFGDGLKRKFLSFRRPQDILKVYNAKQRTNNIEKQLSISGRRQVNIDPGYLDLSKLVLLSTKDYSHRIYAGKGIFAEVTLFYKSNSYNPWPWTYPDYKSPVYIDIFNRIREIYKKGCNR